MFGNASIIYLQFLAGLLEINPILVGLGSSLFFCSFYFYLSSIYLNAKGPVKRSFKLLVFVSLNLAFTLMASPISFLKLGNILIFYDMSSFFLIVKSLSIISSIFLIVLINSILSFAIFKALLAPAVISITYYTIASSLFELKIN